MSRINVRAAKDPETDEDHPYIRIGEDLVMPAVVTVSAHDPTGAVPDVEVDVVAENGRLVANEVRMRRGAAGRPVTTESIRLVRVAELASQAAHLVKAAADDSDDPPRMAAVSLDDIDYVREHGMTDRTLRLVARLYRVALLTGNPPTKMVETTLEVPRSTVGRWVATARERGYLGDAEGPGKAGEARD